MTNTIHFSKPLFKFSIFILVSIIFICSIYLFRLQIAITGIKIFSIFTKNAYLEHILGEYYHNLSNNIEINAQKHFKIALERYKIEVSKPSLDNYERHVREYIIGNYYEYGKGVAKNLITAKEWYTKAKEGNIQDAKNALQRINKFYKEKS